MRSVWVGRSPAGWQFRQRGDCITFPASSNNATARAFLSVIEAKLVALLKAVAAAAPAGSLAASAALRAPPA